MWTRPSLPLLASVAMGVLLGACSSSPAEPPPSDPTLVVTPSSAVLKAGEALRLVAAVRDGAGLRFTADQIVWTSSDQNIATVVDGVVQGTHVGTAEIVATWKGLRASSTVSITPVDVQQLPCTEPLALTEGMAAEVSAETVRKTCRQPKPVEIQ